MKRAPKTRTCTWCGRRRPSRDVMPDSQHGERAPICRDRKACMDHVGRASGGAAYVPRRGCNAVEKAIETVTRREGKREASKPHPLACSCEECRAAHVAVCEFCKWCDGDGTHFPGCAEAMV